MGYFCGKCTKQQFIHLLTATCSDCRSQHILRASKWDHVFYSLINWHQIVSRFTYFIQRLGYKRLSKCIRNVYQLCIRACVGECVFLCAGIYLCYCIRSAPSFYFETKFISFATFNELLISVVYYIVRYAPIKCLPYDYLQTGKNSPPLGEFYLHVESLPRLFYAAAQ